MFTLYSEEQIRENHDATITRKAREEGRKEGKKEGIQILSKKLINAGLVTKEQLDLLNMD